LTRFEADECIKNIPGEFRLYHVWDVEKRLKVGDRLSLALSFHSARGTIENLVVRTTGKLHITSRSRSIKYVINGYLVDRCKPKFDSLSELIRFYNDTRFETESEKSEADSCHSRKSRGSKNKRGVSR